MEIKKHFEKIGETELRWEDFNFNPFIDITLKEEPTTPRVVGLIKSPKKVSASTQKKKKLFREPAGPQLLEGPEPKPEPVTIIMIILMPIVMAYPILQIIMPISMPMNMPVIMSMTWPITINIMKTSPCSITIFNIMTICIPIIMPVIMSIIIPIMMPSGDTPRLEHCKTAGPEQEGVQEHGQGAAVARLELRPPHVFEHCKSAARKYQENVKDESRKY